MHFWCFLPKSRSFLCLKGVANVATVEFFLADTKYGQVKTWFLSLFWYKYSKKSKFFLCLGSCECGVCEWFCEGTRKLWPGDLMLTAAQISTPLLPEICLNWFWFYSLIYKQNWCRNLGTNFPSNGFRIVLEFLILWWIC